MSTIRPSTAAATQQVEAPPLSSRDRPRLAFIGVGWIGQHRLRAIIDANAAEVACVCDASERAARETAAAAGDVKVVDTLDQALALEPDGLVIATPNALHAEQAIAALERGAAVFCQKPLGRTAAETQRIVTAARQADRLLGVDLSYRHLRGAEKVRRLVAEGELGDVFAIDLTFHNAYGPDKAWFFDPNLSGGGCLIDLGVHLIDLALWWLGNPSVVDARGALYRQGQHMEAAAGQVEDFAIATLQLESGATVRLGCSWHASVGRDAVIEATVHGSKGGASVRNVGGSFFEFQTKRFRGRSETVIDEPPDGWFGRAAVNWAQRLARGERYDAGIESTVAVAAALDRIYQRDGASR